METSIPLSYIRIWARKNECSVSFKLKTGDHYRVDATGVAIYLPDKSASAVNTRHAFPIINHYPSLLAAQLAEGPGQQPVLFGEPLDPKSKRRRATFDEISRYVDNYLALLGKLSPIEHYMAVRVSEAGLVTVLQMHAAIQRKRPGETLGASILKSNFLTWNMLQSICLDMEEQAAKRPGKHNKIAPVSGYELSGEILVALGKVTRTQLEYAMHRKRQGAKPLGEILVEMGACQSTDVKNCISAQDALNQTLDKATDKIGGLLVQHGRISQEALDEALQMQQLGRQSLHAVLMHLGACGKLPLASFKRERNIPAASDTYDEKDFADYLLKTGVINRKQLEEALAIQRNGKQVLGELLLQLNRCHTEDIELALNLQRHHRRLHPDASKREKLGDMLVSRHLADEKQIEKAKREQAIGKEQLGATLIGLGVVSHQDFADALELQLSWREQLKELDDKIGQELLKNGVIDVNALASALSMHQKTDKPLGEILIEQEICSPEAVIDTILKRDDRRAKAFLRFVSQMRPVTYTTKLKPQEVSAISGRLSANDKQAASNLVDRISSWLLKRS